MFLPNGGSLPRRSCDFVAPQYCRAVARRAFVAEQHPSSDSREHHCSRVCVCWGTCRPIYRYTIGKVVILS
ncbi:hypothetical protein Y600_5826 [Burkholderia pseudomallei MSHR3709]|nr:hypothetical protein Y600_5826 [Burkholderia pseudomallei MSHR3709]